MVACWLLAAGLAAAAPVDRVIAVIGDQSQEVVTASDVALEAALPPGTEAAPFWNPAHGDALERLVDATLIRIAAADVGLYQPPQDAVRARVEEVHASFPSDAAWQAFLDRWGLDEAELGAVLRRRLVVERFLARNLKADPADTDAWLAEMHTTLAALALRIPVRMVPLEAE